MGATPATTGESGMSGQVASGEGADGVDDYNRPGGTDRYRRPDGTSLYKRPA